MSLRDELNRRLTDFDLDVSEDFIDTLLPWLEQKLSEAQAETNRIIICVWCGHTIERTGDIRFDVKASQAHEAGCEKNPIRREAQAEMAERCAGLADKMSDPQVIFEKLPSCSEPLLIAGAFRVLAKAIRALSPDPEWLERQKQRWELKAQLRERKAARGDAFCVSVPWAMKRNDDRIADLERQLAALPEEGK